MTEVHELHRVRKSACSLSLTVEGENEVLIVIINIIIILLEELIGDVSLPLGAFFLKSSLQKSFGLQ